MGQVANAVRADIEAKLEERKAIINAAVLEQKLAAEAIDVTIPGDEIKLGNTTIKCYHTPGHTEGCTSFLFNVTDGEQTLVAGTHGGVGINSLAAAALQRYNLPTSLQQDFLDGIERLSKLHVDICIGNHPETVGTTAKGERIRSGETDAFVDPEAWLEFLGRRRKLAEDLYAKERAENT